MIEIRDVQITPNPVLVGETITIIVTADPVAEYPRDYPYDYLKNIRTPSNAAYDYPYDFKKV